VLLFAGLTAGDAHAEEVDGSFYPRVSAGRPQSLFVVYTSSSVEIRFGRILDVPPFTDPKRERLRQELNEIPGFDLRPESVKIRPSAPIAALADDDEFDRFTRIIKRATTRVHDGADRSTGG
jgi:hypothetical protein